MIQQLCELRDESPLHRSSTPLSNDECTKRLLLDLYADNPNEILQILLQLEGEPDLADLIRYNTALHLRVIDLAALGYPDSVADERLWRQAQIVLANAGDGDGLMAVMDLLKGSTKREAYSPAETCEDPYCNAAFLHRYVMNEVGEIPLARQHRGRR